MRHPKIAERWERSDRGGMAEPVPDMEPGTMEGEETQEK